MISEAKKRANAKYIKDKCDDITLRVPKGKKNIIKAYAEATDGSLNKFINRAIDETIERDKKTLKS